MKLGIGSWFGIGIDAHPPNPTQHMIIAAIITNNRTSLFKFIQASGYPYNFSVNQSFSDIFSGFT